MKLAVYQGPSPQGDETGALQRVEIILSAAARAGVALVVFPELFLPGYNQMQGHHAVAQVAGWRVGTGVLTTRYESEMRIVYRLG